MCGRSAVGNINVVVVVAVVVVVVAFVVGRSALWARCLSCRARWWAESSRAAT